MSEIRAWKLHPTGRCIMEPEQEAGERTPYRAARRILTLDVDDLSVGRLAAAAPKMYEALRGFPAVRDDEPPEFFAVRALKWMRTHMDPALAMVEGK